MTRPLPHRTNGAGVTYTLRCRDHRRYRAVRQPRVACPACFWIWLRCDRYEVWLGVDFERATLTMPAGGAVYAERVRGL